MFWASHHLEKGNLKQTDWINVVYAALGISPQGYSVGGLATAQYERCEDGDSRSLGRGINIFSTAVRWEYQVPSNGGVTV